jgi:hypothetical protein
LFLLLDQHFAMHQNQEQRHAAMLVTLMLTLVKAMHVHAKTKTNR